MATTKITSSILVLIALGASCTVAQNSDAAVPPPPPSYGFNNNFNPSMAIIIVVLISAFFFMGFFSIYIRQCAGGRADQTITVGAGVVGRSRRRKGLDPAVIETFPTFLYSVVKGLKIGKGTLECAVCLNEFEDEETLRLLPKCDHVFHPECIDAWLTSHVTCPVCRANLAAAAPETATADSVPETSATSSDSDTNRVDADIQVSIHEPDVINPNQPPFQNRPTRSGSTRRNRFTGKFPRSHSTGHSVIQPGENCERFTLRLPEEIRKKIVNGKLNRTTSCLNFPVGYGTGGSSRRGYRGGSMNEESSSRGKFWRLDSTERWAFFSRGGSVNGEGSRGSKFLTSVKSLKRYMSFKGDGRENRPAV